MLCFYLQWNVWITRFHLPLFVLWAAAIATTLNSTVFARLRTFGIVLLVVTSQFTLFYNESRPVLKKHIDDAEIRSVLPQQA